MRQGILNCAFAAISVLAGYATADVDPIVIKGSKFFYQSNNTQFFIRGVAYQADPSRNDNSTSTNTSYVDPLADPDACSRDIPYLKELRTNVVRVYAVDPSQNHDSCMNQLANAGIYVISDLSDPTQAIDRDAPEWTVDLLSRYTSVIDALHGYSNMLGFFAGNEVSNAANNTAASAYVKAAVRDSKAYIKSSNYRSIGVGYATNDDPAIRSEIADYFNCGDQTDAIDFWGYNIYSWCGDSSYEQSGFEDRTIEFSNYSVPAFFSEYGCNLVQPRTFTQTDVIYGPNMSQVWSGGIVYMYYEEVNNYGLVDVSGQSVTPLPDFTYLSSRMQSATPTGVLKDSYTPTNSPQACPTLDSDWQAEASPLPPTPDSDTCQCEFESLSCVPKSSLSATQMSNLFGTVCGLSESACSGIQHNATTGKYGAYSMCNSTVQLAVALDTYYKQQSSQASACNFGGMAMIQNAGGKCSGSVAASSGPSGSASASKSSNAGSSLAVHHAFKSNGALCYGYLLLVGISFSAVVLL
ncbi:1,3-beta-glucanosyltransferase gel3, partial [Aureobasidium melanogenum]